MPGEIHRGDIGTIFLATIKDENSSVVDISNATTLKLNFLPPNTDNVISKDATFYTNGTDGKIKYVAQSGDLSVMGIWQMQGFISSPSGSWSSNIDTFKVYPNLGDM